MEVRLKHNEFRDLVNELRDTADRYGGTDQLRDQLAHTLARRVRPVPEIVEMRPVLERIDARLACDVLSASSTVEVLKLARDEIMVLAEEVMELRAALQHEADRVKAAKAEVAALRAELAGLRSSMEFRTSLIGRTEAERDELRAKIERMEKQESVATVIKEGDSRYWMSERLWTFPDGKYPLYALPGAQAHPASSEQDESVRKSWVRFSNELHRSPDAPYPGMSEAFEQHFSQSFTDRDWRVESGIWAAAWKAAKHRGAKGE